MNNFNFLAGLDSTAPPKEEYTPRRPILPVPPGTADLEEGIPIPPKWAVSRAWRYPLDSMRVGDSFLEPWAGASPYTMGNRIRAAVRKALRRHPDWKYSVRMSPDEQGFRVWRVA